MYEAYGSENVCTLTAVRQLGDVLRHSGRMDEALKMYMHALEGYRRIGDDWYGTMDTVRKIAQVLAKQRKLWQAAGLVEQVYQFGIDHYRPKSAFTLTDTECYAHILWEL